MPRKTILVCGLVAVALATGVPSASAATEFGDTCTANNTVGSDTTLWEMAAPGNPLPTAAPVSGVLTKWKVNVVPVPTSFTQTGKVLRVNQAAKTAQVVGEASLTLHGGANELPARIPIQAGDHIGLFEGEPTTTLQCEPTGVNTIGGYDGGGSTAGTPYLELPAEFGVPLAAVIEPDADKDGYGDETQDKCPQSAAIQTECPPLVLGTVSIAGKSAITVYVSSSTSAPVSVSGSAPLPKAPKGKAGASAKAALKKVTQTVTPGKISRFKLKLPPPLKSAVSELPPGKSITVSIVADAVNLAGIPTTSKTKLKLKG